MPDTQEAPANLERGLLTSRRCRDPLASALNLAVDATMNRRAIVEAVLVPVSSITVHEQRLCPNVTSTFLPALHRSVRRGDVATAALLLEAGERFRCRWC